MSRDSLRRSGVVVAIAAALLAVATSSCDDPVAALIGVTAVSGPPMAIGGATVMPHQHRCTIPMSDIESPPMSASYVTSTELGHFHFVDLSRSALMALAEPNGSIQVETRTEMGSTHTHVFTFMR